MPAHIINATGSASVEVTSTAAMNRTPVLGPVPMSTSRILSMADAMSSRTLREQLLMSAPLYVPALFRPVEMRRSYAGMGHRATHTSHASPILGIRVVGANILEPLRSPSAPVPLFMVRENAAAGIGVTNHTFNQVTETRLLSQSWVASGRTPSTSATTFQPASPITSNIWSEPSHYCFSSVMSNNPREDMTEMLDMRLEAPKMKRSLGMINGEKMTVNRRPPTMMAGGLTTILLEPRRAAVRALARQRQQNALHWIAQVTAPVVSTTVPLAPRPGPARDLARQRQKDILDWIAQRTTSTSAGLLSKDRAAPRSSLQDPPLSSSSSEVETPTHRRTTFNRSRVADLCPLDGLVYAIPGYHTEAVA